MRLHTFRPLNLHASALHSINIPFSHPSKEGTPASIMVEVSGIRKFREGSGDVKRDALMAALPKMLRGTPEGFTPCFKVDPPLL